MKSYCTQLTAVFTILLFMLPARLKALSFSEFVDPNPNSGNQFGQSVVPLSNGNVVITSPLDDAGGTDAGAVYLFNGSTGALMATLRGNAANNQVGSGGVTVLSNGNYVVISPSWDNGAASNAGAVTWGSAMTGVSGTITSSNSLVGTTAEDQVGSRGILSLNGGGYVVISPLWDNGGSVDVGAVTWGSGTTGISGVVSISNSLVGSTGSDSVGASGVWQLTNGNYVVKSTSWDNGTATDAGAVTWCSGTTGRTGAVSSSNSLVGSTSGDIIGSNAIVTLSNGNYIVVSQYWNNGSASDAGAVTWCSGTTGRSGVIGSSNSLVGSTTSDFVGSSGVSALSNGNYVVRSQRWDNGSAVNAGAVTWGSGTAGVSGVVSASNSLVGSSSDDQIGQTGITLLSNGNYVIRSAVWNSGAIADVGAVTWGSGTAGVKGAISASNSLIGSTSNDRVGLSSVVELTNGHYVVCSGNWNNGGSAATAGAATWCNGTTGRAGVVNASNSLVGSKAFDNVSGSGVLPLTNGNYVVISSSWANGAIVGAGAVTWCNGSTGSVGIVSISNSLVGTSANDTLGIRRAALSNGNYVVNSPNWNNGSLVDVGAVTWGNGTTGVTGAVSTSNSLVGTTANDQVGNRDVMPLSGGSYLVISPDWDNGTMANAGAVTWGSGTASISGAVSASNSLVGSRAEDKVGSFMVNVLANGNYVVASPNCDNGGIVDAGAVTWGSGASGVRGAVSSSNSLVGSSANDMLGQSGVVALSNGSFLVQNSSWDRGNLVDACALTWGSGNQSLTGTVSRSNSLLGQAASAGLRTPVVNSANNTFYGVFLTEVGGKVRVGSQWDGLASLPKPEIAISGGIYEIVDGDSTPASHDLTDFGNAAIHGGLVVRTFTISNLGNGPLSMTGSPRVVVDGAHAADFSVITQPAATVNATNASTTFQVSFDPSATGLRTATLSIDNDDNDENPYNFSIQGFGIAPEISISGSSSDITDGDSTPSVADHTDFGATALQGGTVVRTFTIQNSGLATLNLSGSPRVVVGGAHAEDFSVIVQPAAAVNAINGSTTFQVIFDPSVTGLRTATLSIENDDSEENPFNFSIQGTGTVPEIVLSGNNLNIVLGDSTPSLSDHTDFGIQPVTGGTLTRSFTIQNTGLAMLNLMGAPRVLIGGSHAADFTVIAQPAAALPGGNGSTRFLISFDPSVVGLRTATVSISNNDLDENPFNFTIQGTGSPSPFVFTFTSVNDVAVTSSGYTASGEIALALGYAPTVGSELLVVKNTDVDMINGRFSNLAHGQTLVLDYGGQSYEFAVSYYGGTGNDLVLLWRNSRLMGWGNPSLGQLASSRTNYSVPGDIDTSGVLAGKLVVAASTGGNHSVFLCLDGTLAASGHNLYGQLGDNNTPDSRVPVAVDSTGVLAGRTPIAIATGADHNLALCSDGTVVSWGRNDFGQLGNNSTSNSRVPVLVSTSGALAGKKVVAVRAGSFFSLALCSDGTLVAWGSNSSGSLGSDSAASSLVPVPVSTSGVLAGKNIQSVSAGAAHVLALCSDGTLVTWGQNIFGQLGINNTSMSRLPVEVFATGVLAGKRVDSIICGAYHSFVLCSDGTMAAWGWNSDGRLGDQSAINATVPVMVNKVAGLFAKIPVMLGAGMISSMVLCADGTIAGWGGNLAGILGDNTLTDSLLPVLVDTSTLEPGLRFSKLFTGNLSLHCFGIAAAPAGLGVPEIALTGNGADIASGDNAPSLIDHTDFGSVSVNGGVQVRLFTIQNTGSGVLNLTGSPRVSIDGPEAAEFTVTTQPSRAVGASNGSTSFQVSFSPSSIGLRTATVSIINDDGDENPFTFSIQGTGAVPEMAVSGNGADIVNGDSTPSLLDHTDFGVAAVNGGSVGRSFTIQNTGAASLRLTGTPKVVLGGAHSGDFTVIEQPMALLEATNGSSSFQVVFDPSASGLRVATLTIANDDSDESSFSFSIQGSGTVPMISISGNNTSILNGDSTPSTTDHTDFGGVSVASGMVSRTFEIRNTGLAALNLSGTPRLVLTGANASDFSVITLPAAVVAATTGSTIFQIRFDPSAIGLRSAVVSMVSDDSENNLFSFSIQGTGTVPEISISGKGMEIADGDSSPSSMDDTDFGFTSVSGGRIVRAFTIQNTGSAPLNLTGMPRVVVGGAHAADFTVTTAPAALLEPSTGMTSFQITFTPSALGLRTATVSISNEDGDENPYNFSIQGAGSAFPFTFMTAGDVPVTASSYAAAGPATLALGFVPQVGTELTVVRNTGIDFISGTFSNLAQGQVLTLIHAGVSYDFVVNYYGGTGNDLVLMWKNNRILAWGSGWSGQLGNNSLANSGVPVAVQMTGVLAGKTVVSLAAGSQHCLALCSDGTLAAWGDNNQGQLGERSMNNSLSPVLVAMDGVLSGRSVVAIAAGASHSLALCSDGGVVAWGDNSFGCLGNNSISQSREPVAVNTSGVLAGKRVVAVSAGMTFSMVLCSDGAIVAWGRNDMGQLGNSSTTHSRVPVAVNATGVLLGRRVVSIAAGGYHGTALCADGSAVAWGFNSSGQLGNISTASSSVPVMVTTSGSLSGKTMAALIPGSDHTVALCSDGSVVAWGFNNNGQLGNNTMINSITPVAVNTTGVLAGKTVMSVGTGGWHSAVICSDNTVASWGSNFQSQLGNNSVVNSSLPVPVVGGAFIPGERWTKIVSGNTNAVTLALISKPGASTAPKIAVYEGSSIAGTQRMHDSGAFSFGTVIIGTNSPVQRFTIHNSGTANLTGLSVSSDEAQFTVNTTGMSATLVPDATTSFTVMFNPSAPNGLKNGLIRIISNDADENPFVIPVAATAKDGAGNVAFDSSLFSVNQGAVDVTITLVRTGGTQPFSVLVSSADGISQLGNPPMTGAVGGTNSSNADFVPLNSTTGLVSFAEGEMTRTLRITLYPKTGITVPNKRFNVTLGTPTESATLGSQSSAEVRILADDAINPVLTVLNPATSVSSLVTASPIQINGFAGDLKGGLNAVQVMVNGGSSFTATITDPSNPKSMPWFANIELFDGLNTVIVSATDLRGNLLSVTRSFTFTRHGVLGLAREAPPGVAVDTAGVISVESTPSSNLSKLVPPPANTTPWNRTARTGAPLLVKARANAGYVFSHWLGLPEGAAVVGDQVSFTMPRENVLITAVFDENRFASSMGEGNTFHGTFGPADLADISINSTGWLTGTLVPSTGSFSGQLTTGGLTQRFAAIFLGNGSCVFTNAAGFRLGTSLTVGGRSLTLSYSPAGIDIRLDGTQVGLAKRARYSSTSPAPAALQGLHTVVMPAKYQIPFRDLTTYPQGTGFGSFTTTATGTLIFAGTLADGTAFSASTALVAGEEAPFFAALTTPGASSTLGSFSGLLNFDASQEDTDVTGTELLWIRPSVTQVTGTSAAALATQVYTAGWPTGLRVDAYGARYDAAQSVQSALNLSAQNVETGNAELNFSDGKLSAPGVVNALNIAGNNVTTIPTNNSTFSLVLVPSTGQMSGTFTPNWTQPVTAKPAFRGIMLQKGGSRGGYGFFLSNRANDTDPESGRALLRTPSSATQGN